MSITWIQIRIETEEAQASTEDTSEFKNKYSNLTVFISNLSYDVDESKLENVFKGLPGFKEVRLIKHWSGKSKGYGYVDFATAVRFDLVKERIEFL